MRKKVLVFLLVFFFVSQAGRPEIKSLSQVFLPGKGVKDLDHDSIMDTVSLRIIIPDSPSASETATAAEIAARANLESVALNLFPLSKGQETKKSPGPEVLIFIGKTFFFPKSKTNDSKGNLVPELAPREGIVCLLPYQGKKAIVVKAGSEEALLQTGRAFFLRWPYLWEIWGRETGVTYQSVEKDLAQFLNSEDIEWKEITTVAVRYEFPSSKKALGALKKLKFNTGEIKELRVTIEFGDRKDRERAEQAFSSLKLRHKKGEKTEVLNYPGCALITFQLRDKKASSSVSLSRLGYPKRILTPSYKPLLRLKAQKKDFDLTTIFTTKGVYADTDSDGIADDLESLVIIPQELAMEEIVSFASRLMLDTAGASFPVISLDSEIEDSKALTAPLLVGKENELLRELLKKGKLKIPPLEKHKGLVKVIPQAFNTSNALAILGGEREALEKTLLYLSTTFPYFKHFGQGNAGLKNILEDGEEFLKGRYGSTEAYFFLQLKKLTESLEEKELEYFRASFYLPQKNTVFERKMSAFLRDSLKIKDVRLKTHTLDKSRYVFKKEQELPWEADEVLRLIKEKKERLKASELPLKIEAGVSESPPVRQKLRSEIENFLAGINSTGAEVNVLSAYKQGFFWLVEKVLPELKKRETRRLVVTCAEEKDDFSLKKRFYSEPYRWLQELYPVDEILSSELSLPLENIEFMMKSEKEPVYKVEAYDSSDKLVYRNEFSPRRREITFLKTLPEWGRVTVTTGWLRITQGATTLLDTSLKTDLERFWDFYQEEVLSPVYSHIMKKTNSEPSFSKQPYFKRLFVELWLSEPDYRLGLDEEIVSSLEAIHDEIYFDTLDFLRGITELDEKEEGIPEDTSRYSAPGNVLPLIHPSTEGEKGRVRVAFEDWITTSPLLEVKWKEKGKEERSKKIKFVPLKAKSIRIPSLTYNADEGVVEGVLLELVFEKESEYMKLLDMIESLRELVERGMTPPPFTYPGLKFLTLKLKHRELEKEEVFPVSSPRKEESLPGPGKVSVPTDEIISPEACLGIVRVLDQEKAIRTYIAGVSYEKRKVPVLEIFTPLKKYVSIPRLITMKPTLYVSGRQHANEVSSTNYILKLAELLASDSSYQEFIKKVNIVLHPMENPDGAALACRLQKITPFHSLHAGRYSSLGIDVGYQVKVSRPLLPEAKVRRNLYRRWQPDIYLNLHGYPSHEWVQPFSNYSPYLFRDYWIPRGWFVYYRALREPFFGKWKEAGDRLREFIIREMNSNEKIRESNEKFYQRYYRWAARWQPHMNYLELEENLNIYAKRHSSKAGRLTSRRKTTFVEETPELMDETASGAWLDFLSQQGLSYLRAHLKYLSQLSHQRERFEEEIKDRIRIQFARSRPGKIKKTNR